MARHAMGKKKSKSKAKKPTKRRRVGAGGGKLKTLAMNIIAVGGGLVAMNEVAILGGSAFPSLMASPITTGLIEVAAGALLAYEGKSGWMMFAGLGAAANGLYTILKGTGAIGAGPQTMSYQFANRRAMGDPRLQFVAGPTTRIGSFPNNFASVAGRSSARKQFTS